MPPRRAPVPPSRPRRTRTPAPAPARPRRTRLELDARRAQLLALGRAAFSATAYDDVAIDDLARSAGISKGLLYHYFPTKRSLYVAGLRETAAELVASTIAASASLPPIDRVRAGLDAFFEHVSRQGRGYLALMRGGVGSDPEIAAIIQGAREHLINHMLSSVAAGPLGALATSTPLFRIGIHGWFGMVEAASIDWIAHQDCERVRVRELMVQQLLAMLALVNRRTETP